MKSRVFFFSAVAVLVLALLPALYATRIQTVCSLRRITDYDDGYNLYRMNISYDYDLSAVIRHGIRDDRDLVDAICREAFPLLPISVEVPRFGCTAFSLTDRDGQVLTGRNYDFRNDTSALLVYCAPKDGYRSMALAALDNISANDPEQNLKTRLATLTAPFICLDGLNEKGVSIAVLTLDSEPTRQQTGKPQISTTVAIRLVLDHAATTEEAIELLRGYDMYAANGRDYQFYITDASGNAQAVAYDLGEERRLIAVPSQVVTNFFISYQDRVLPFRHNGVYGHGRERYDTVMRLFSEHADDLSETVAWEALKASSQLPNPQDVTSNTQWSVVYNNTNLTAQIVLRRHWGDFIDCTLFSASSSSAR